MLAASCSKSAPSELATKHATSPAPVPTASVTTERAAALSRDGVRLLLDGWLAAQNAGDFAAYERLYAERFAGVRRSGPRTASFDRKGWMRERKDMFGRSMHVEASQVELSVTPQVARITLQQAWSSGDYRDVGPKQMVVVATAGGPRIAREEMLSSRLAGPAVRAAAGDLKLLSAEGVILDTNPQAAWAMGPARPGFRENVALRAVDETRLPAELRAWKGRRLRALRAGGASCEAMVSGFEVRAEVVPHFGSVQSWHGELGQPPRGPAEIAEQVWEMASVGGRSLVGRLASPCDGVWALDAARKTPPVAVPEPADPKVSEQALRALHALPAYAEIQQDFMRTAEAPRGRWEDYAEHDAVITAFRLAGKLALVHAFVRAGNGCGDFEGVLTAVYTVRKGTQAELEYVGPGSALRPTSAFELDGDFSIRVLFGNARDSEGAQLWHRTSSGSSLETLFSVPFLDCGC
jgi:hypothetical protein